MRYLLITLLMMSCAGTKITTNHKTITKAPVNITTIPDHFIRATFNELGIEKLASVAKKEHKDETNIKVGRFSVKINTTTTVDSSGVRVDIDSLNLTGKEDIIKEDEKIVEVPYCNRQLYILIGFIIGVVVVIAIRK